MRYGRRRATFRLHDRRPWIAIVATVAAIAGTSVVPRTPPATAAGAARADEFTASQNTLRDGWDASEPGLSPAVVGGGAFGQIFSTPVNGQVYAQPIVVGSTVIVATENDWVYGLNATTGAVNWSLSLGTPWPSSAIGCADLTPDIGVTGTPVYDPSNGAVYLVARVVPAGGSDANPVSELVGITASTGKITETVPISGAPVNDPGRPFNSFRQMQRPALLLMNGTIYAAFGSFCDKTPYAGYVAAVNLASRSLTLWTDEAGIASGQAGIWQSGGGIMSDGPGRLFVASGNGVSPPPGPGATPPPELGDSVIQLGVQSDGSLQAQDFFSPADALTLNANDLDQGSGPPVGLPFGTSSYPNLLMQAGKDGVVRLLDRDALGGREQGQTAPTTRSARPGRSRGCGTTPPPSGTPPSSPQRAPGATTSTTRADPTT